MSEKCGGKLGPQEARAVIHRVAAHLTKELEADGLSLKLLNALDEALTLLVVSHEVAGLQADPGPDYCGLVKFEWLLSVAVVSTASLAALTKRGLCLPITPGVAAVGPDQRWLTWVSLRPTQPGQSQQEDMR